MLKSYKQVIRMNEIRQHPAVRIAAKYIRLNELSNALLQRYANKAELASLRAQNRNNPRLAAQ